MEWKGKRNEKGNRKEKEELKVKGELDAEEEGLRKEKKRKKEFERVRGREREIDKSCLETGKYDSEGTCWKTDDGGRIKKKKE